MAEYIDITLAGVAMRLQTHPRVWSPTAFAHNLAEHLVPYLQPDANVLELGLGCGVLSILAGARGAAVSGLDINPDAVRLTAENWARHGLPESANRFQLSDRFAALEDDARFDLVWSNPPVLPRLEGLPPTGDRDDFEVAGPTGRLVLDAMITQAGRYVHPDGQIVTIATSLQGQQQTETLLNAHWQSWRYLAHLKLALTDECGPAYLKWWQERTAEDGQRRVFQEPGDPTWWHDVWILHAAAPRPPLQRSIA